MTYVIKDVNMIRTRADFSIDGHADGIILNNRYTKCGSLSRVKGSDTLFNVHEISKISAIAFGDSFVKKLETHGSKRENFTEDLRSKILILHCVFPNYYEYDPAFIRTTRKDFAAYNTCSQLSERSDSNLSKTYVLLICLLVFGICAYQSRKT